MVVQQNKVYTKGVQLSKHSAEEMGGHAVYRLETKMKTHRKAHKSRSKLSGKVVWHDEQGFMEWLITYNENQVCLNSRPVEVESWPAMAPIKVNASSNLLGIRPTVGNIANG